MTRQLPTRSIDWAAVHRRLQASALALDDQQDPARARRLVEERTRQLAQRASRAAATTVPLLMLQAGGDTFALRIAEVAEVAAMTPAAPLPRAGTTLIGVVNRHGTLCQVHDLAALCGRPTAMGERARGHLIVLRAEGGRIGLRVDLADAIREVRPAELDPADDHAPGRLGSFTRGGFNLVTPQAILIRLAPSEAL